jgi:hypothetical protein
MGNIGLSMYWRFQVVRCSRSLLTPKLIFSSMSVSMQIILNHSNSKEETNVILQLKVEGVYDLKR